MTSASSVESETPLAKRARDGGMRPINYALLLSGSFAKASSPEEVQKIISDDPLVAIWLSAKSTGSVSVSIFMSSFTSLVCRNFRVFVCI